MFLLITDQRRKLGQGREDNNANSQNRLLSINPDLPRVLLCTISRFFIFTSRTQIAHTDSLYGK